LNHKKETSLSIQDKNVKKILIECLIESKIKRGERKSERIKMTCVMKIKMPESNLI
jgi:hypothetical protein